MRTKTEWQGLVIAIALFFAFAALLLLILSYFVNRYHWLRRLVSCIFKNLDFFNQIFVDKQFHIIILYFI